MSPIYQHINFEFMNNDFFSHKNSSINKTSKSIIKESDSDADKLRMDKIENLCIILPLAILVLGIIVMLILYKIYM